AAAALHEPAVVPAQSAAGGLDGAAGHRGAVRCVTAGHSFRRTGARKLLIFLALTPRPTRRTREKRDGSGPKNGPKTPISGPNGEAASASPSVRTPRHAGIPGKKKARRRVRALVNGGGGGN